MFITRPDVLKWCLNMHTFKTKEEEDLWGRSLLNVKKQWSGPFGERIIPGIWIQSVRQRTDKGRFPPRHRD